MKRNRYLTYVLVLCVQLLICNYFHVSAYIMLSILPCMILLLPTKCSTLSAMLIAFASGMAVDILAEGVAGLNAVAIVPVAASRRWLCDLIFGGEPVANGEDISIRKYGFIKMSVAIMAVQALFLIIYIWADGAASRSVSFNILRFGASFLCGVAASLMIANIFDWDERN